MSPLLLLPLSVLLAETPSGAGANAQVRLVQGTAEIRRGKVAAARALATEQALVEAVWQRAEGLLDPQRRKEALRRSLGVKVRELIARFRTRKVQREGGKLTVLLEVTVDDAALTRRLGALGVPLLAPGVLLVAHCDAGPLREPLGAALARVGIRSVQGPWSALMVPAQVAAVRARPEAALVRARQAQTRAAVVASCHPEPPQVVAPGSTAVRLRLLVTLHAVGSATPILWQKDATAMALGADVAAAARAALDRALLRLTPGLSRELPRQLPAGPRRAIGLQILGALPLQATLGLADRLSREIEGVEEALPDRFARGETWLRVLTTLDLPGLRLALGRVTPPQGFQLSAQIVQPQGHLALFARLVEEQP